MSLHCCKYSNVNVVCISMFPLVQLTVYHSVLEGSDLRGQGFDMFTANRQNHEISAFWYVGITAGGTCEFSAERSESCFQGIS